MLDIDITREKEKMTGLKNEYNSKFIQLSLIEKD
jgi:hypothetical protein